MAITWKKIAIEGSSPTFAGLTIANGGTIGQAAGPLLNFDDTNNYLEITGCNVGIGTVAPVGQLSITMLRESVGLKTWNTTDLFSFDAYYNSNNDNFRRYLDISSIGGQNGNAGGGLMRFITNPAASATGVERLRITEDGNVGIGTVAPLAKLAVNGGVNIGADTDPGDNNLSVVGTITTAAVKITTGAGLAKVLTSDADGDATWETPAAGGGLTWSIKTSATNAVKNNGYICDTKTTAAFTLTLPATPTAGDVVAFKDGASYLATNNLTIGRNGEKIMGLTEDLIVNTNNASGELVFSDATYGWRV